MICCEWVVNGEVFIVVDGDLLTVDVDGDVTY